MICLSVTVMSPSEKRLNRSRCRLDCGLGHGIMGVHISATLRIRLNRPCAAAMRLMGHRLSSVVCRSVCPSVCHTSEPCKNGWTDRDTVWVEDSGGPREPCIRWGSRYPHQMGQFWGQEEPIVSMRTFCRQLRKNGKCAHMGRHFGPTWRIRLNRRLQRRCVFMSNYFDHLFHYYSATVVC